MSSSTDSSRRRNIDAQGADLTVDLRDINGVSVFSKTLQPQHG